MIIFIYGIQCLHSSRSDGVVSCAAFLRFRLTESIYTVVSQPLLAEVIVPKKVEITCDFCAKDLTTVNSGFDEYRLCLSSQGIYNTSNIRFGMEKYPPIKNDCYFCSLSCLKGWLTQRAPDLGQAVANPGSDDVAPSG